MDKSFIHEISYIAPVAVIFLYFFSMHMFYTFARKEDEKLWSKMGCPHLIKNNSMDNTFKVLAVLLKAEYSVSTSKQVRLWGRLSRLLWFGFMGLLINFMVVVVILKM